MLYKEWLKGEKKRKKLIDIKENISNISLDITRKKNSIMELCKKALKNIVSRRICTNIDTKNSDKIVLSPLGIRLKYEYHLNSYDLREIEDCVAVFTEKNTNILLQFIKRKTKRRAFKIVAKHMQECSNLLLNFTSLKIDKKIYGKNSKMVNINNLEIGEGNNILVNYKRGGCDGLDIEFIGDYIIVEQLYGKVLKALKLKRKLLRKNCKMLCRTEEDLKRDLSPHLFAQEL